MINKLIYPNYSYVTSCIHGHENASPISRRLDAGWLEEGERWESEASREGRGRQRLLVQPDGSQKQINSSALQAGSGHRQLQQSEPSLGRSKLSPGVSWLRPTLSQEDGITGWPVLAELPPAAVLRTRTGKQDDLLCPKRGRLLRGQTPGQL